MKFILQIRLNILLLDGSRKRTLPRGEPSDMNDNKVTTNNRMATKRLT